MILPFEPTAFLTGLIFSPVPNPISTAVWPFFESMLYTYLPKCEFLETNQVVVSIGAEVIAFGTFSIKKCVEFLSRAILRINA